jgi:hypothetical protein
MFYREQKYTRIITIISCTYLFRTKIYCREQKYTGAKFKTWTGINGHNLDTERNDHLCCGWEQKNWCPQMFCLCIQQQLKYMLY